MTLSAKEIAKAVLGAKPPESGNGEARHDLELAAGNVSSAFKSGDSSEMASSLKEFIALCNKE